MTMEELLESLTKKAKTECEEAHRQIVASLNGQAGLHIIKGEVEDFLFIFSRVPYHYLFYSLKI